MAVSRTTDETITKNTGTSPWRRDALRSPCRFNSKEGDFEFWATVCKMVRPMLSDRCLSSVQRLCLVAKQLDGSR